MNQETDLWGSSADGTGIIHHWSCTGLDVALQPLHFLLRVLWASCAVWRQLESD